MSLLRQGHFFALFWLLSSPVSSQSYSLPFTQILLGYAKVETFVHYSHNFTRSLQIHSTSELCSPVD
jgi:hypothetical protein